MTAKPDKELSNQSFEQNDKIIKDLAQQITVLGDIPNLDQNDQKNLIKNLTKQLEIIEVKLILQDKSKNKIKDDKINGVNVRLHSSGKMSSKELRKLVDDGKKELGDELFIQSTELLM